MVNKSHICNIIRRIKRNISIVALLLLAWSTCDAQVTAYHTKLDSLFFHQLKYNHTEAYRYVDSTLHSQSKKLSPSQKAWFLLRKSRAYYASFRKIDSATIYALQAKELYETAMDNNGLFRTYIELSGLSINDLNKPTAKSYYQKAKDIAQTQYDSFLLARTHGRYLSHFSTADTALLYLLKAKRLHCVSTDANYSLEYARMLYHIGWAYLSDDIQDYNKALAYLAQSKKDGDISPFAHPADYIYINTLQAFAYRKLDKLDSASLVLQQAAEVTESPPLAGIHWHKMNVYRQWAWIEYSRKNYQKSTQLLGKSRKETDLYYNERLESTASQLANDYQKQLKDQEITTLKAEDSRKSKIIYGSIFASLLFIALGLYAFAQYRKTKKQNVLIAQNRDEIAAISKNLTLSLKEIHHRIKNNLQVISSLLSLQKNSLSSPEAKEALAESQNRIRAMALIHEQLYSFSEFDQVSLRDYVVKITDHIATTFKTRERITFQIEMDDAKLPLDESVSIGMIINELATNALKYGFPDEASGTVHIAGQKTNGIYTLQIHDTGIGLPADFQLQKQRGVGYQIMQALSIKLKGKLEVLDNSKAHIQLTLHIS